MPLYVLGRRMEGMFPIAFLGGDRALAIAAMSYDGSMDFGLIADLDALTDLDVLAGGLTQSLDELVALARRRARVTALPRPGSAMRAARRKRRAGKA
jgi:diacylglycerol O-acyltransferase